MIIGVTPVVGSALTSSDLVLCTVGQLQEYRAVQRG